MSIKSAKILSGLLLIPVAMASASDVSGAVASAEGNSGSKVNNELNIQRIPSKEEWRNQVHYIEKFWLHPDALGKMDPGEFPTWRCNNGNAVDGKECRIESLPKWVNGAQDENYVRMISRQTFAYGALFNLTGNPEHLIRHQAGVNFLMNKAKDPEGGFYSIFKDGTPVKNPRLSRTAQDMAYAVIGLSMNAYLTGDPEVLKTVAEARSYIYNTYYDDKQDLLLWVVKDSKEELRSQLELVAQLDQLNAYLLLTWRLVPEADRKQWTNTITHTVTMINRNFYDADKGIFIGSKNNPDTVNRHMDYGHRTKSFWLEYLVALGLDNQELKNFARDGMKRTLTAALQPSQKNWYEINHDWDASWWVYAELDQSALTLALTDDFIIPDTFRPLFDKYTDKEFGEWKFGHKAHFWRSGYHSTEHALIGTILSDALRSKFCSTAECRSENETALYFAPLHPESMHYSPYLYSGDITGVQDEASANTALINILNGNPVFKDVITFPKKNRIVRVTFNNVGLPKKVTL